MSRAASIVGVILATVVAGCGDGEQSKDVAVMRGEPSATISPELARKRAMQAVTVRDEATDSVYEIETETLTDGIWRMCQSGEQQSSADDGLDCLVSYGRSDLCMAAVATELAKGNQVVLDGTVSDSLPSGKYRVVTINPGARLAFIKMARYHALLAWSALSPEIALGHCMDSTSNQTAAAAVMTDLYFMVEDLTKMAVETEVGAADQELASTTNVSLAARRAWNLPELSRGAAVTWLLGGGTTPCHDSLLDFPGAGETFCDVPRLSYAAEMALKVLREAAPSPEAVLAIPSALELGSPSGTIGIRDLLNKRGLPSGSVLERLEHFWGVTIEDTDIAARLGLDQQAFVEARAYLAQEIQANSRSLTEFMGNEFPEQFRRYTATAIPPMEKGTAYYAAIGRSAPMIRSYPECLDLYPWHTNWSTNPDQCEIWDPIMFADLFDRGYGLDRFRDQATWIVECLQNRNSPGQVAPLNAISNAISGSRREVIVHGYVGSIWTSDPRSSTISTRGDFLEGWGYTFFDGEFHGRGYRVVRGELALECLTLGTIDGQPCDDSLARPGGAWNVCDLIPSGETLPTCEVPGWPAADEPTWYLLKSRSGASYFPPLQRWTNLISIGGWEAVTGWKPAPPPKGDSDLPAERIIPVYSDIESRVREILAPSRTWCTKPETNCLGMRDDDPIPLENELMSDGSDYETSWKHYLELAKEAAARSDVLAEEYFQSGISLDQFKSDDEKFQLGQDERSVAKLEELQQICGSAARAETLLKALGGLETGYSNDKFIMGDCDGTEGALPSPYDCVKDKRVVNFGRLIKLVPELEPLRACVASATDLNATMDFVHLGDADLCVPNAAIDGTCGTAGGVACGDTLIAPDGVCPEGGYTRVSKQDGLAFFHTEGETGAIGGREACAAVRKQRKTKDTNPASGLSSQVLNYMNLAEVGKSLQLEASLGGYYSIRGPNGLLWTTGAAATGPSGGKFPCGSSDQPSECKKRADGTTVSEGLVCSPVDCTNHAARGAMNDRLLKAYFAAKLSTWRTDDPAIKVVLPGYIHWGLTSSETYSNSIMRLLYGTTNYSIRHEVSPRYEIFRDETAASRFNVAWTPGMYLTDSQDYTYDFNGIAQKSTDNQELALFRAEFTPKAEMVKQLWNGLGGSIAAYNNNSGCIKKLLLGTPESSAMSNCTFGDTRVDPFEWVDIHNWKCGANPICLTTVEGELRSAIGNAKLKATDEEILEILTFTQNPNQPSLDLSRGNTLSLGGADTLLDGMEMLCEASVQGSANADCGSAPPILRSLDDLGLLGGYLKCLGNKIMLKGATATFRNIPKDVLDPLRSNTGTVYSDASSGLGEALENLKSDLLQVYKSYQVIGHVTSQFGSEMEALRSMMRKYGNDKKLDDLEFASTQMQQLTSCVAATSNLGGMSTWQNPGSIGAAAATCANSFAQIRFADKMRDLKNDNVQAEVEIAIARFNQSFDEKAQLLDGQSTELSQALYRVNAGIGGVNALREQAARILTEAMWLQSNDARTTGRVHMALDNKKSIAYSRYRRALLNARKSAYLARKAIEQRLGMSLDTMVEDLPLVEAPAHWANSLCYATEDLDYERLSSTILGSKDVEAVANGFLGDYVQKLENVIESYQLAHGFQNGRDTAVISLRDDILNVRSTCRAPSRNLLVNTADLTPQGYGPRGVGKGWFITGCNETLPGYVAGVTPPNCIALSRIDLPSNLRRTLGYSQEVPFYSVTNGEGVREDTIDGGWCPTIPSSECGWLPGAGIAQTVHLKPGPYLAWVDNVIDPHGDFNLAWPSLEVDGQPLQPVNGTLLSSESDADTGLRVEHYLMWHRLASEADVTVRLSGGTSVGAPRLMAMTEAQFAKSQFSPANELLSAFELTDAEGMTQSTECEDRNGDAFRTQWTTGCVKLCADGYTNNCVNFAETACYHELAFTMGQSGMEANSQFVQSGFARGNFNYRLNRVGLNFVGSGLRNCADSNLPQSCYSNGFVTYSLTHEGPYTVRNHLGTDFTAALFEGRVEHARGLATERYITNPMSTADRSLLEEYMHAEMQGRPLSGAFVLRVWDDPNLNFAAIKDIQLVLDYGYWTRLTH